MLLWYTQSSKGNQNQIPPYQEDGGKAWYEVIPRHLFYKYSSNTTNVDKDIPAGDMSWDH